MHYTYVFTDRIGATRLEDIRLTERFGVNSVFFAVAETRRRRSQASNIDGGGHASFTPDGFTAGLAIL